MFRRGGYHMRGEEVRIHDNLRLPDEDKGRKPETVKRKDAPMDVVFGDRAFRAKAQEILFPLKITTDRLVGRSSFTESVLNNTGGGIPGISCRKLLELMEEFDEENPLTVQAIHDMEKKKEDFVFFYLAEEENGYLSNWFPSYFVLDGRVFTSTEQYLMYYKAKIFGDEEAKQAILDTDDQGTIKQLGKQVRYFRNGIWDACRDLVMEEGLRAKFGQNKELKQRLLETGDAILAECAPKDLIWGIGLSGDDERRFDRSAWRGENRLGEALMKIRVEMKTGKEGGLS